MRVTKQISNMTKRKRGFVMKPSSFKKKIAKEKNIVDIEEKKRKKKKEDEKANDGGEAHYRRLYPGFDDAYKTPNFEDDTE